MGRVVSGGVCGSVENVCVCLRACVRVCVRACVSFVRACVCVCVLGGVKGLCFVYSRLFRVIMKTLKGTDNDHFLLIFIIIIGKKQQS